MVITAIRYQQKNPERVSVFIDGKYGFSLTVDQLLAEKLVKNQEIQTTELDKFKKMSSDGKLRSRALEWLMRRPHSEKEVRDYLYKKKAEKDVTESLIAEFKERKYIDDVVFARWFAENRIRKQKSTKAIAYELRTKGISPQTIQSIVTSQTNTSNDEEALHILVNKLRKRDRYKDDNKLIRYLLSKGFVYEDIKRVL